MKSIGREGLAIAALLLAGCSAEQAGDSEPSAAEHSGSAEEAAQPAMAQQPVAFLQCRSCHSVEPGQNGIGPSLHGIVGRQAASVEGFDYSPALREAGITWNRASLDTWMAGPMKMVPGTRMVIAVPNQEARTAIIDYLEALK